MLARANRQQRKAPVIQVMLVARNTPHTVEAKNIQVKQVMSLSTMGGTTSIT